MFMQEIVHMDNQLIINQIYNRTGELPEIINSLLLQNTSLIGIPKKCLLDIHSIYLLLHNNARKMHSTMNLDYTKVLYELLCVANVFHGQWLDYISFSNISFTNMPLFFKSRQWDRIIEMIIKKEINEFFFFNYVHKSFIVIRSLRNTNFSRYEHRKILCDYIMKFVKTKERKYLHVVLNYFQQLDISVLNKMIPPKQVIDNYIYTLLVQKFTQKYGDESKEFSDFLVRESCFFDMSDSYEDYKMSQTVPMPEWSNFLYKNNNHTCFFLHRNDMRGLVLGKYTDCCLYYPHEMIRLCMLSPNACFWVVEDRHNIVAQSCVFKEKSRICFDNIECSSNNKNIQLLFEKTVEHLKEYCSEVTLGTMYNDIDTSKYKSVVHAKDDELPYKEKMMSDAKRQFLIWQK